MVRRENPWPARSHDPVRASAGCSQLFPVRGMVDAAGPLVVSRFRVCQAGCLFGPIPAERLNLRRGEARAPPEEVGSELSSVPRYGMLTREICHILVILVASSAVATSASRTGS